MTVLFFADTRFPIERANGVQTMATCHALAARGHDVTLVVRPDSAAIPRDPYDFYGLPRIPRLAIRTIGSSRERSARRMRFLHAAVREALSKRDAIAITRDLGFAALLARLPSALRPRLVYESHGIASVVADEMPRLLGKPELAPTPAKLGRLERRERRVWARADAYVCITRALRDDLASRYGPRPNVFVVPDGASPPPTSTAVRPSTSPERDRVVVGYGGHLYPWKGVDTLVHVLPLVPDARLLVVGGHRQEADFARISNLAEALGVADRMEMTGLVPQNEVSGRLEAANVLALPNTASTISERYTSPLKLFEYLWMGRPIVASDTAAIREVLTHGANALLVPAGDPRAFAAALDRLRREHGLALALAQAARTLAPTYTWDSRAEKLEAALECAPA